MFTKMRSALGVPYGTRFNKEAEERDKLKGDEVAAELASKERFGQRWFEMPMDERWAVIRLLTEEDDPLVVQASLEQQYGFEPERIDAIAEARLPAGHGRLGPTALANMLDELKHGTVIDENGRAVVLTERQAMERVWGDNPTSKREVEEVKLLPRYQEVVSRRISPGTEEPTDPYDVRKGRLTNPTVHIGLNQLRRLVNAMIQRYGRPEQIALELARDLKLNDEQKAKIRRDIARNTRAAEQRSEKLRDLREEDNGYNRVLLKLWEGLNPRQPENRECIYCGKPISIERLFSNAVDIDHILPWSRTLDDSQANRIVCCVECNRMKGNRAPFEVTQWQPHYDEILARADRLERNQAWRFGRDAMKKFQDEESFLARQLTDTQYLSRLAHEYLGALFADEEPDEWGVFHKRNHIRVIPGRMTEMLRRHWGLNSVLSKDGSKNRNDHRHHAIDALVVGLTTRSLLQRIATAAAGREAHAAEQTIGKLELPWPDFRADAERAIGGIVVSHKADHGSLPQAGKRGSTAGQLHNDTAYGLTGELDGKGNTIVVRRKSLDNLKEDDIGRIRAPELRARLGAAVAGHKGAAFKEALQRFAASDQLFRGIRRVRLTEPLTVIPIRDRNGVAYKGYKGDANYRYDVWEMPDGKWLAEIVTMFNAHQPGWRSAIRGATPTARKVLSLQQGDTVRYEHARTGLTTGIVVKFGVNGQITLAAHNEAGELKKRDELPDDPFKYFAPTAGGLKKLKLRQVRVNEIGQVFDPGPQDRDSRTPRKAACLREAP